MKLNPSKKSKNQNKYDQAFQLEKCGHKSAVTKPDVQGHSCARSSINLGVDWLIMYNKFFHVQRKFPG